MGDWWDEDFWDEDYWEENFFPAYGTDSVDTNGGVMSEWKIVIPEAATNMCLYPSLEIITNVGEIVSAAKALSSTYQCYGAYSLWVQTITIDDGISIPLSALSNATHYVTMRVHDEPSATWKWSLDDVNMTTPTLIEAVDDTWNLYGASFPAAQANGSTALYVYPVSATADFYIDGVDVVAADHWTTHIDGTQPGCEWNGIANASTSSRSAYSRAGGRVYDLADEYDFHVEKIVGAGAIDRSLSVDNFALLPGGQLNNVKKSARPWSLIGPIIADDADCDLNEARQRLIKAVSHDAYPKENGIWQPYRLWYTGGDVEKEIAVNYETGLGADWQATTNVTSAADQVALNMLSADPFFYQIGENSKILDTNDSATTRYIAGRMRDTGQWSALGLTANPTTCDGVLCIEYNPVNGLYYIGGDFTGWNGVAGRDFIASYNPDTNTWATVGAGSSVNEAVWTIAIAPNGDVYIGGEFTNVGDANGDYVAYYDISAGTWASIAAGGTTSVYVLQFGNDGTLYIAGSFANWGGIANADAIAKYSGGAYSALSTGISGGTFGTVYDLCIDIDGNLIVAGSFGTAGGVSCNNIAIWNGTAFSAYDDDDVISTDVGNCKITSDGTLFIGCSNGEVFERKGNQFIQIGDANAEIGRMSITPDNNVMVCGSFTKIDDFELTDGLALWNGASWAHVDINLPSTTIRSMCSARRDVLENNNYDILVGFYDTAASYFSGAATVTNNGSVPAYPKIVVTRTGGTTATLQNIRNETTGDTLWFDYDLLDGETLTIDLSPTNKSITSSMFGRRLDAVLPNSDFGKFSLLAGNNTVTAFVNTSGSPAIVAYMLWRDPFDSFD